MPITGNESNWTQHMSKDENCSVPPSERTDEFHWEVLDIKIWNYIGDASRINTVAKISAYSKPQILNVGLPAYFIFHPNVSHSAVQDTEWGMNAFVTNFQVKNISFLQHTSVLLCLWEQEKKRGAHIFELQGELGL